LSDRFPNISDLLKEKYMKHALLMGAFLAVTLAACGKQEEAPPPAPPAPAAEPAPAPAPAPTDEGAASAPEAAPSATEEKKE
jgi:hypothetical protein